MRVDDRRLDVKLKALVYALRVEKQAPDEPVPML